LRTTAANAVVSPDCPCDSEARPCRRFPCSLGCSPRVKVFFVRNYPAISDVGRTVCVRRNI